METNYFKELYDIDVREKVKTKNGLSYLSWATAWAEVKKIHPDANYKTYKNENNRPWFDDGKSGWVETSVTINDIEHIESLPIMDFKNKSIPAENIVSTDANKAIQRSLTKACARHGLGLYIYEGEDLPEEIKKVLKLQQECVDLLKTKSAISENTQKKVEEVCKSADKEANGNPRLIDDLDTLEALKKSLMAIRKVN